MKEVEDSGYELHGAKGVAAKLQEWVVNAYPIDVQDLGPKACQLYSLGFRGATKATGRAGLRLPGDGRAPRFILPPAALGTRPIARNMREPCRREAFGRASPKRE